MQRIKYQAFLLLFLPLFLAGCPQTDIKGSKPDALQTPVNPRSQSARNQTSDTLGTGDSGGGNSFKGRPLESYIKDPRNHRSFHIVEKKLDQLIHKQSGLWRIMRYVLDEKLWYFVPGELNTLPRERIESAVPTDQVALQDASSVWINDLLLEPMESEDQAELIMHELLMGAKILRSLSSKAQCLAVGALPIMCTKFGEANGDKTLALKPADYTDIRRLANLIMDSDLEKLSPEEFEDSLAKSNFSLPIYPFYPQNVGEPIYFPKQMGQIITATYLDAWFFLPWYSYDWRALEQKFGKSPMPEKYEWESSASCEIEITMGSDGLNSLMVLPRRDGWFTGHTFNGTTSAGRRYGLSLEGRQSVVHLVTSPSKTGDDAKSPKFKGYELEFGLTRNRVTSIRVVPHIEDDGHLWVPDPKGQIDSCSLRPKITL